MQNRKKVLQTLDRFLINTKTEIKKTGLMDEIIAGWIGSLPKQLSVNTINLYISAYSQFARYLHTINVSAFVPERAIPELDYTPYIFSKEDMYCLVNAADKRQDRVHKQDRRNAACFSILLRMLIGCGFRINELLNLKTADVDLIQRQVIVRNGKGKNDRIVPIHDTLAETLIIYVNSGIPQKDGFFFPSKNGNKLSYSWARDNFNQCLVEIGIIKPRLCWHARNICIHCIRHSFAVAAFQKLDNEGKDLYDEAPILATYLGHKNIMGTEKYLHMTTENCGDILKKMACLNKEIFPEVSL